MRVLDLPRRRYSVPETIMRKYRLRQRAESNSSSSRGECRRRRCTDKSIQTSPRESIGRTSSFPFLATPSPCIWSCTTSDYQTVSDRTTSTQDSTLSVPSTTPEELLLPLQTEEVETQVSFPDRADRTTSVTGLKTERTEETVLDIAVSIETDLSDETVVEANRCRGTKNKKNKKKISIACQTGNQGLFKVPEINVFKDSSESQNEEKTLQTKEKSSQVTMNEIFEEIDQIGYYASKVKAEIACAGSNYEEFPLENPIIPRYSAIPRTNSMIVNTSSVDYSSDSELSLTDSLEDPDEYRTSRLRKQSKHDERMVRGEVTMEQERRRLPKAKDAYAYFLSLTGEEEIIREYSIPDWLRTRLRKREQEIKKEYEDKLLRHQQYALYRKRKKTTRRRQRVNSYSSGEKICVNKNENVIVGQNMIENNNVHFDESNNNVSKNNLNPGPSHKNPSIRLVNGNNMGLEPKIDNISRNKHNNSSNNNNISNHNSNNINGEVQAQGFKRSEMSNKSNNTNPNLVHISEVIKIEMSDNLGTVITKEKQINLAADVNLKDSANETIQNELSNTMKSVITKSSDNYSAELTDINTIQSSSQLITKQEYTKATSQKINQEENLGQSIKIEKSYTQVPEMRVEDQRIKKVSFPDCDTNYEKKESLLIKQDKMSSSKIEIERKIADILITALEENTRARQMSMQTTETIKVSEEEIEGPSKKYVDQGSQKNEHENEDESPKTCSLAIQTDKMLDRKEENAEVIKRCNVFCNTEPYLVSVFVQTSSNDIQDQEINDNSDSDIYEVEIASSFDEVDSCTDITLPNENVKMVDKACNTVESASISTQTNESILQSNDIVNRLKKEKSDKKKDVQFPPQVIKQIITGTGEYKTVELQKSGKSKEGSQRKTSTGKKRKVNKGTNTEQPDSVTENNKNIINNNTDTIPNRPTPTPFCKNIFSSNTHPNKSEILELNVPTCTCHMCTLQRISPRSDLTQSKIPQSRKNVESKHERKQTQKYGSRRSNVNGSKFRMFEVIPEEKNSSAESIPDDGIIQETSKTIQKGVLTELHLVDQIVQVGSKNVNAATNTEPNTEEPHRTAEGTQTCNQPKKKSNLVIGRFRSENQESPMLVRQYKGRASLSTGHAEGQEELLTLSKGWINFYLLKDNLDLSDSNGEEGPICQAKITGRRRVHTVEKEEDKVEEYTVEIHATPEPEPKNIVRGRVTLPEINTSSSSSTPEGEKKKSSKPAVEPLPGVRKSKRTRRSQINMTREAITELGSASGRGDPEMSATRAVEVACSEHSISSITSSTVILSESPPPQQLKLPERRSHHRHRTLAHHVNSGSNWTVTVAGSSGSGNDPPPDVEMKLTFGKQGRKPEEDILQYQVARNKRQDQMLDEFAHLSRNERRNQLQCALQTNLHPKSSLERTRGGTARDNFNYEEDYINRLSSRRSKYSTEDGSETTGDLHVTGLAITPEKKPRVPTQSERDILRPQRYKFTR